MKLQEKMEDLKKRFEESVALFEETQEKLIQIQNDQRVMQGEYKTLLELGIDEGIFDEEGNVIEKK